VFALALRDGAVVLIRRKPIKAYPGIENHWWIPGGANEDGESFEQTAVRELREETGLEIEANAFLLSGLDREHQFLCVFLQANAVGGSISAETDPDGITAEVRAFRRGELSVESLWVDTDKILLSRAGFLRLPIDALLKKHGFDS
jgi:ADP-ribose pyrophosphatase YjhB (NUDIX family)